jgi:hypothetical protein
LEVVVVFPPQPPTRLWCCVAYFRQNPGAKEEASKKFAELAEAYGE